MARNWDSREGPERDQPDDDLGSLIRWGLEDAFAKEDPPEDLWLKIRARIEPRPKGLRAVLSGPARRSLSIAPLIQTVVASSLVLAFAFGADRSVNPRPSPTASRSSASNSLVLESSRPLDIPRIHPGAYEKPEQVTHQRVGGVAE